VRIQKEKQMVLILKFLEVRKEEWWKLMSSIL